MGGTGSVVTLSQAGVGEMNVDNMGPFDWITLLFASCVIAFAIVGGNIGCKIPCMLPIPLQMALRQHMLNHSECKRPKPVVDCVANRAQGHRALSDRNRPLVG